MVSKSTGGSPPHPVKESLPTERPEIEAVPIKSTKNPKVHKTPKNKIHLFLSIVFDAFVVLSELPCGSGDDMNVSPGFAYDAAWGFST